MSKNYTVEQIKAINVDDFASRGQLIYQGLKQELESNYIIRARL